VKTTVKVVEQLFATRMAIFMHKDTNTSRTRHLGKVSIPTAIAKHVDIVWGVSELYKPCTAMKSPSNVQRRHVQESNVPKTARATRTGKGGGSTPAPTATPTANPTPTAPRERVVLSSQIMSPPFLHDFYVGTHARCLDTMKDCLFTVRVQGRE